MGLGLLPKARPPSVIDLGADAGDTEPERDEDAETELDGQGPAFVGADQRRDDDRRDTEDDGDGGEEDRRRTHGSTMPEPDERWNGHRAHCVIELRTEFDAASQTAASRPDDDAGASRPRSVIVGTLVPLSDRQMRRVRAVTCPLRRAHCCTLPG